MDDRHFRWLLTTISIVFTLSIGWFVTSRYIEKYQNRQILHGAIERYCGYDIMSYKILSVSTEEGISSICVDRDGKRDCCEGIVWTEEMRATVGLQ